MNPIKLLPALMAALLPVTASAHVVLTERQAVAGAYHAASFRIHCSFSCVASSRKMTSYSAPWYRSRSR